MKCFLQAISKKTHLMKISFYTEFTSSWNFVAQEEDRNLRQYGFPLSIAIMTNGGNITGLNCR
jgi:hypothetical protein